ncbi:FAD-dependent monooxygenase [Nocardia sp. NBC_01499]|uniref:FAD-dependent monooxygenase n=1 Tax=Nocardia sp. NBC_01499 TaxID=2903597 RepID=UPI003868BF6C
MGVANALVVGAGIGGLAAAAALGRKGVDVDVVEIREPGSVLGVGINQPGNALRALDALGVLDEVLAAGFPFDGNDYRDRDDERIVLVPSALGSDRVPANCGLSRRDLHDILLRASKAAGATITYGTEVRDVVDDGTGVDVTFSNGEHRRYDLVAAFDGVGSAMRRRVLGTSLVPQYTGSAVWRKRLPRLPEIVRVTMWHGVGVKGGLVPMDDKTMYMLLVTSEQATERPDEADLASRLATRLAQFAGPLARVRDCLRDDPHGIVYSPLVEVNVPLPWHRGRVIVLGDAAHATTPHLTQGAAMAIEDAVVLADEVTRDRGLEESLTALERLRHPRTQLVQETSHKILVQEQSVTTETLPRATDEMRANLAEQTDRLESVLNQPFRATAQH